MPMPDQLTEVALSRGGNPDLRESIGQKQIQDVQSIARVGLLFSYAGQGISVSQDKELE